MHHSEQKCAYFCSEWCIVGYGTGTLQDLLIWLVYLNNLSLLGHFMASHITNNSTICSTGCPCQQQREHQSFTLLALYEGNPLVTIGFPLQRARNVEAISLANPLFVHWICKPNNKEIVHTSNYWLYCLPITSPIVSALPDLLFAKAICSAH